MSLQPSNCHKQPRLGDPQDVPASEIKQKARIPDDVGSDSVKPHGLPWWLAHKEPFAAKVSVTAVQAVNQRCGPHM